MSRTDKTAPYAVKLRRGDLAARAHHDHRNGVCELRRDPKPVTFTPGGCYLDLRYTGTQVCGCAMCHAVEYPLTETQRRRRDRHRDKAALRKEIV